MTVKVGDIINIHIPGTLITEVKVAKVTYARKEVKPTSVLEIICPDLTNGEAFVTITIYE